MGIVSLFVSDQAKIDELLAIIGEEKITGFQLKDAFDSSSDLLEVKRIIQAKINHNRFITEGHGDDKEFELNDEENKDDGEKKEVDILANDVEQLLKDIGFGETIEKLKENDIADPEIFFALTEDEIIAQLEIKTEGKKLMFKKKIKKLKEENEKKKADAEAKKIKLRNGESFELLQKKSSVRF